MNALRWKSINVQNKKLYVISLYGSPSQSKDEFEPFLLNFEHLVSDRIRHDPLFMLVTGDFIVQMSYSWNNDLTASEGSHFVAITSSYGLSQLICGPKNILPSSCSYVDLIFMNQSNSIIGSGVHVSLYPNCHQQMVYAKLNLRIECTPQPRNPRPHCMNSYFGTIKILTLNCSIVRLKPSAGRNCLKISKQLFFKISSQIRAQSVMTRTSLPRWYNDQIKIAIEKNNHLFKNYMDNGRLVVDCVKLKKRQVQN